MDAATRTKARSLIIKGETVPGQGFIRYLYLDSLSKVTVGYGFLLPTKASMGTITLVDKTGIAAKLPEKEAEWQRVQAISPYGTKRNYAASGYATDAVLFMTVAEGERIIGAKMDEFLKLLRKHYPGFDTFPPTAQIAMLDMAYNLEKRIFTKFEKFTTAINEPGGPDWIKASTYCNRPQLSEERNEEIAGLFREAAASGKRRILPPLKPATSLGLCTTPTLPKLAPPANWTITPGGPQCR